MMRPTAVAFVLALALAVPALAHRTNEPATSPEEVTPLPLGARLPQLELRAADGSPFDLTRAMARKPTVLILYRGGW